MAATSVAATVKLNTNASTSNEIHDGGGVSRLRMVVCSQSVAR